MIKLPSDKEIQQLQDFRGDFSLSIYSPYIAKIGSANPNRIQLKNILKQAEISLATSDVSSLEIRERLEPVRTLLEDHEFWPPARMSLAIFTHPKLTHTYHLPDSAIPYLLTIGRRFNLEPLLNILADTKQYYLLSLNHNNVQLFKGNHYELKPVSLPNFPTSLTQTLQIDELPNVAETHTVGPTSRARHSEAFHGHYNNKEINKQFLKEFFTRIDHRLHRHLHGKKHPLIIGGVDYLLPIYRQVNTYPHLVQASVSGNLEHVPIDDLRQRAWRIVGQLETVAQ